MFGIKLVWRKSRFSQIKKICPDAWTCTQMENNATVRLKYTLKEFIDVSVWGKY